jgi:antirestriction protein ArdC
MKNEKGTLISFYKTHEFQPQTVDGKQKNVSVKLDEPVLTTAFLFNAKQLKDMPPLEPKAPKTIAEPDLRAAVEKIIAEKPNESSIKDALKTNIAVLFLSAELQKPFELGDHIGYIQPWSQLLKEEPAELFKAANDAQYIADKLLKSELAKTLNKGDVINYKGDSIKVLSILKGKTAQLEYPDGKKQKVGPKDGLYSALIDAKNNIREMKPQEETQYAIAR